MKVCVRTTLRHKPSSFPMEIGCVMERRRVFLTVLKAVCYNPPCVRRPETSLRGGAVAARQAHNLKVLSSNLSPATLRHLKGSLFPSKPPCIGLEPVTWGL
jgi:hypothetical protein